MFEINIPYIMMFLVLFCMYINNNYYIDVETILDITGKYFDEIHGHVEIHSDNESESEEETEYSYYM